MDAGQPRAVEHSEKGWDLFRGVFERTHGLSELRSLQPWRRLSLSVIPDRVHPSGDSRSGVVKNVLRFWVSIS